MIDTDKINFKNLSLILIVSYVVYAIIYLFIGEKVPVHNGFGWDGFIYGNGVRDFPNKLINKIFLNLHVERLLPSALLYYIFSLFRIEFSDQNIIYGFQFFNLIMVLGSIFLARKIVSILKLGAMLEFLFLVALIVSFPVLKVIPYYPVLTDAAALFLGFLTLYGFLTKKNKWMITAFILSCFIWPVAAFAIPLLMIFRMEKQFEIGNYQKLNYWLFGAGILILDLFIYYFFIGTGKMNASYPAYVQMAPQNNEYLNIILGTVGLNIYLLCTFGFFLKMNIWENFKMLISAINMSFLIFFVIALGALKIYIGTFPHAEYMKMSWYVMDLFTMPTLQPFSNIICFILYFGPVIFLIIFKWNAIIEYSRLMGVGFMLFFIGNLVQCLDVESRHMTFFWPFLVFLFAVVYKDEKFSWPFIAFFIAASLLFSKVWFQINTEEFLYSILNEKVLSNEVQQRYFMHQGKFMNFKYYLIQTPVVIAAGLLIYYLLKHPLKRPTIS